MFQTCHHVMPSGRRCESPALRGYAFCYYHARRAPVHKGSPDEIRIELPATLDRDGIAQTLHQLLNALANNRISARRASILLCGLQMASSNPENSVPVPRPIDPDFDRLFTEISAMLSQMDLRGRAASKTKPFASSTAQT